MASRMLSTAKARISGGVPGAHSATLNGGVELFRSCARAPAFVDIDRRRTSQKTLLQLVRANCTCSRAEAAAPAPINALHVATVGDQTKDQLKMFARELPHTVSRI